MSKSMYETNCTECGYPRGDGTGRTCTTPISGEFRSDGCKLNAQNSYANLLRAEYAQAALDAAKRE